MLILFPGVVDKLPYCRAKLGQKVCFVLQYFNEVSRGGPN